MIILTPAALSSSARPPAQGRPENRSNRDWTTGQRANRRLRAMVGRELPAELPGQPAEDGIVRAEALRACHAAFHS